MANGRKRYSLYNPACGDVWLLKDKTYLIIDYHDSLQTGFTITDGDKVISRNSFLHTTAFSDFLTKMEASPISSFEEMSYPVGVDIRGWTDSAYQPDAADRDGSRCVEFLKSVLSAKEVT